MAWLLFAFAGPIAWAISTHIDKYLVERYFKRSPTPVLMVFTALAGAAMLPFVWVFDRSVFSLAPREALVTALSGALYMGAMILYLQALQTDEASVVAPLFPLSALWGFALARILLGETLDAFQIAGGALIVAGAAALSFDGGSFRNAKIRLVLRMLGATFALALSSVIFKFFAVRDEFWTTTFWTYAGEALVGALILAIPAYRRPFVLLFRTRREAMLGVNGANELINLGGGLSVRYALLLAPLALVQAVSSTTPLFVFLFGILLTRFVPKLGREDLSRRNLARKGIAAAVVAAGVVLARSA